jgi:hypothetical protein
MMTIGGPEGAGHTNGAPQIRSAALGMTKRGGSFEGKGGCWMKGQLLNRDILPIEFGQLFSRPCGTGRPFKSDPGLASWAKFSEVQPSLRDWVFLQMERFKLY